MRSKILRYLKIGWCVAALMILLMGTQVCTATDEACAAAGDTMFLFMLLLSFPTGIVFLTISLIFVNAGGEHYPADYILAWFIMAGAGCLQWFVVVPRLLDKPKFTLLDLRAVPVPVPPIPHLTQPPSQALVTAAQSPQIPPTLRGRRIRAPKRRNRVPAFDSRGQTPLERVINH